MSDYDQNEFVINHGEQGEIVGVQWFPGHMARAKRTIQKNLLLVDIVVEILDARAPLSSANPDLSKIIDCKPRLVLLNKSDLADPKVTEKWVGYFKKMGTGVLVVDSKSGAGLSKVESAIKIILKNQIEKRVRKGMSGRPIRGMVVGIPNVGKSSFINKMAGKKKAKVEDRPGVTRGKQWIDVGNGFEFLDMPGVLWPKFEDKIVGEKLAFLGTIKDNILNIELLAARLLEFLYLNLDYRQRIFDRYKIGDLKDLEIHEFEKNKKLKENLKENENFEEGFASFEEVSNNSFFGLLKLIAKKRGMIVSGGEVDLERAAIMVLDEFRAGKLGKISVDMI